MKIGNRAVVLSFALVLSVACEPAEYLVDSASVERIVAALSSDEMMGREAFTPGADMAADFISAEFEDIGLDYFGDLNGYEQDFPIYSVAVESGRVVLNGQAVPEDRLLITASTESFQWTTENEISVRVVGTEENSMQAFREIRGGSDHVIVLMNRHHERFFNRLKQYFSGPSRTTDLADGVNRILVLTNTSEISSYEVDVTTSIEELQLTNVVGIIPGKRTNEFVLFGAHHDHVGVRAPVDGDSIANGANDDASGVAAVIELARYFKARRTPTRTLVFIGFAAEEKGMIGSGYFAQQIPEDQVITLFNVEMIGKEGPDGPNTAWITGYYRSDFGTILQDASEGTGFSFFPEDTTGGRSLFYGSDNAPFARLGIPAHTISTTPMDPPDPDYHQVSDELETLDVAIMTSTIQGMARAAIPIVSGAATPARLQSDEGN